MRQVQSRELPVVRLCWCGGSTQVADKTSRRGSCSDGKSPQRFVFALLKETPCPRRLEASLGLTQGSQCNTEEPCHFRMGIPIEALGNVRWDRFDRILQLVAVFEAALER